MRGEWEKMTVRSGWEQMTMRSECVQLTVVSSCFSLMVLWCGEQEFSWHSVKIHNMCMHMEEITHTPCYKKYAYVHVHKHPSVDKYMANFH